MDTFGYNLLVFSSNEFVCEKCDYKCSRLSNYNRHILTDKHKRIHFGYILDTKTSKNEQNEQNDQKYKYKCLCGKVYRYSQGLSKHKKMCLPSLTHNTEKNKIVETNNVFDLVLEVCKQNKELLLNNIEAQKINKDFTDKLMDMCKISNNTNIIANSNNKTFNLNLFLNETCKDAMNIMDFVNSINITMNDFEKVGELGYVEGISNIIIKNLNQLDITKRPIHCTDKKREILYIKDDGKWEKDDETKNKVRNMIKYVAHKNTKLLASFREKYPDCNKSHSKFSDQYNKLLIETMGGSGDNDAEKEDKIIKNISKKVLIDK